ncbi:hypothetical protein GQ55_5G152200 [Panicum hallii var. hallii]|uniref:Uncharacterized protein n=1 Tax=Panicum hallii var. hallii TaxID=1504633 RepID=A0A2T7DGK2_9POAL|nr:hypothetical protein GQ55_5G152200 [Panicum hallii var. hallii]
MTQEQSSRNCLVLASNDPFRAGASILKLASPPSFPPSASAPLPRAVSPALPPRRARAPHGAAALLMPRGVGSGAAATNPSRVRRRSPIPRRPIRRRGSSPARFGVSSRFVLPR